ncbi:SDR family oxidoreductase [Paludibacterium yongneupense]|uniref:SDR family oxidoreductase n=1 Tax=Paludibacterium yongneupense TaxID=400061 RepID=UPI000407F3AA|nr:SDR family oxidoreductase [Paludibacterium yongneupense]
MTTKLMTEFDDDAALSGRVLLVTGASQGIGRAAALRFAALGATVVLLGRSRRALAAAYDEIVLAGGPEPAAISLDLLTAGEAELDGLARQIASECGRLDGILHCASYLYALSPLTEQTIDEWMNQYRINTVAPFALTRACLPLLRAAEDAAVLFVGETHGLHPGPFWGGFGASKAALAYLAQVAANEWDVYPGLRVNLLVPGPVNSPLRMRTHPGEDRSERGEVAALLPHLVYWMGPGGRGRSGETIELDLRRKGE